MLLLWASALSMMVQMWCQEYESIFLIVYIFTVNWNFIPATSVYGIYLIANGSPKSVTKTLYFVIVYSNWLPHCISYFIKLLVWPLNKSNVSNRLSFSRKKLIWIGYLLKKIGSQCSSLRHQENPDIYWYIASRKCLTCHLLCTVRLVVISLTFYAHILRSNLTISVSKHGVGRAFIR